MLSQIKTVPAQGQSQQINPLMLLLGLGMAGVAVWKGADIIEAIRSGKETEKSRTRTREHELNIRRTQERIRKIEARAYVSGINSYKKTVTVNVINLAKEIIKGFYLVVTDSAGVTRYHRKADKNIEAAKIKAAIFSTPLNGINMLQKVYSIYTGKSLLEDCQRLPLNDYAQIKAIFTVAFQKFK